MAAESAGDLIRVVALLGAAVVAVPLFKRIGLGSVLGYLAAGLVIGPFGLHLVDDPHAIIHIAEFGVVMFLFVIGLEMHPSHLWHLRRQIFGLGSVQVVICMILLTFVGILFGFSWQVSFVSVSGFVLTSTAIVMQVLNDRNETATLRGQRIVSILLFEDLIIVPLLAVVTFLSPLETTTQSTSIWQTLGIALLSLLALILVGRFLLNPLFRILANSKAREVMTAAALFVVLGASLLMEMGGLSMAMGAFVAGVLLSESSFRHQLEADIEPFRGLLLGLFFLGVGMSLDLNVVAKNWQLILAGVIALMITKAICIYAVARIANTCHSEALERALLMAQGGEFAFVLFAAASAQGVIDAQVNANMTAIVVLSMVFTPIILIVYQRFNSTQKVAQQTDDPIEEQNPIIVIGMGRFGQVINNLLIMSGYQPTIIDKDPVQVKGWTDYGCKTYFGDASREELLIKAGIEKAMLLVVAIDNPEQALSIVRFAKSHNPTIRVVARAFDRPHTFELYQAGADDIVRETFDSALRAGKDTLQILGIPPEVAKEISEVYFTNDRNAMGAMARVYDAKLNKFENKQMIEIAHQRDTQTRLLIHKILEEAKELKNN